MWLSLAVSQNDAGPGGVEMEDCGGNAAEAKMHFSKALFRACLVAGQWLFLLTGGLALLSIVSDWLRSDPAGRTGVMLFIGLLCLALAAAFYFAVRFLHANE